MPARISAVGRVDVRVFGEVAYDPSQAPKKNSLSLRMGPPSVMAPMLRLVSGFSPELAQLRARRLSSSCSQVPVPWKVLVPDLVSTVTEAPPAIPCSASKLAVVMLTVSTVSAGAT